jgi:hypothetical protein
MDRAGGRLAAFGEGIDNHLARTSLNACCVRAAEGLPGFERNAS